MKTLLTCLLLSLPVAQARTVHGVEFPETRSCQGVNLPLQGTGLRTATWMKIKIFVLGYYAQEKQVTSRPVCFDIVYLRDFDEADSNKGWRFQFDESSVHPYPKLEDHVKTIQEFFGEIKGARKQSLELVGDVTKVYENGAYKGEIKSEEFQKNFLGLWFGPKPPTKKFQKELLK
jgi:hypothetical protein